MNDSAYIIDIEIDEENFMQVFATNKFQMKEVINTAIDRGEIVRHVESLGDIMTATDYINDNADNDGMVFGNQN
jgi:hypothetical protein